MRIHRVLIILLAIYVLYAVSSFFFALPSAWIPGLGIRRVAPPRSIPFDRLRVTEDPDELPYDLIVGIPTVFRPEQRGIHYLHTVLSTLLVGLEAVPHLRVAVAVLLIDRPRSHERAMLVQYLNRTHIKWIERRALHVLLPADMSVYATLENSCEIERQFNDSLHRSMWRTKQVIDAALLANYAARRARFYLHLEDDVKARYPSSWLKTVSYYLRPDISWEAETVSFAGHCNKPNVPIYLYSKFGVVAGMFGLLMRASLLDDFVAYALARPDRQPIDWLFSTFLHVERGADALMRCAENLFYHIGTVSTKIRGATPGAPSQRVLQDVSLRPDAESEEMTYEHWADCDALRLWPLPRRLSHGHASAFFSAAAAVITSHALPALAEVQAALRDLLLTNITGSAQQSDAISNVSIQIEEPIIYGSESYTITANSTALLITARSELGILCAWRTLRQILRRATYTDRWQLMGVPLHIEDEPRLAYRGMAIDSTHGALSVDLMKNVSLAMAAAKLNVLHWRLHDELTITQALGCLSESQVSAHARVADADNQAAEGSPYSAAQVREVVRFAERLGIRVIPELPLPAVRLPGFCRPSEDTRKLVGRTTGDECVARPWALTFGADLESVAELNAHLVQYLLHLRALFASSSTVLTPHTTVPPDADSTPFYVHFSHAEKTAACRERPGLPQPVADVSAAFVEQFAQLCSEARVAAIVPMDGHLNLTAATFAMSAPEGSNVTHPRPISAWSLKLGCLNWRDCYSGATTFARRAETETVTQAATEGEAAIEEGAEQEIEATVGVSDLDAEVWGGAVSAKAQTERQYGAYNVWLRMLAVAERMWRGGTHPAAPQRLHLLCKRLALDRVIPYTACALDSMGAARDDVCPALFDTGTCALLPAVPGCA